MNSLTDPDTGQPFAVYRIGTFRLFSTLLTRVQRFLLFACCVPSLLLAQEAGLHRLVVGKDIQDAQSSAAPSPDVGSNKWRLGKSNITQQIVAAYRYNSWIVIFGWNGCCNGVTTVIDATTGLETLEFLTLGAYINDQGVIIFHQWNVHFTDPALLSDSINALDLNNPFPSYVPVDQDHNPLETTGLGIYPRSDQLAPKHHIFPELVLGNNNRGGTVFLIDQPASSEQVCFVSLSLKDLSNVSERQHCIPTNTVANGQGDQFHISRFAENSAGELLLDASLGIEIIHFIVNKATLVPARQFTPRSTQEGFRVP